MNGAKQFSEQCPSRDFFGFVSRWNSAHRLKTITDATKILGPYLPEEGFASVSTNKLWPRPKIREHVVHRICRLRPLRSARENGFGFNDPNRDSVISELEVGRVYP